LVLFGAGALLDAASVGFFFSFVAVKSSEESLPPGDCGGSSIFADFGNDGSAVVVVNLDFFGRGAEDCEDASETGPRPRPTTEVP
jgi:hypothetical protein